MKPWKLVRTKAHKIRAISTMSDSIRNAYIDNVNRTLLVPVFTIDPASEEE